MEKKGTIHHISSKKRSRPKIRFNLGVLLIIFIFSFVGCFALYMVAANQDDDFLGDGDDKSVSQEQSAETTTAASSNAGEKPTEAATSAPAENIVYPVPQSAAVDESYFESVCLVTDATLLDMGKHTAFKDVIGGSDLTAAGCNEATVSSSYGVASISQVMQLKKPSPSAIYFMLGSDIGVSETDAMVDAYKKLLGDVRGAMPDAKIYVMQLPPVPAYQETVSNDKIDEYNKKLIDAAKSVGVYCIDTNSALRSAEGDLKEEYRGENGLNEKAYKAVADYIRTHTV